MRDKQKNETYLHYHSLGFNLIPLVEKSKSPAIKWKIYQNQRVDELQLLDWLKNDKANYNIGIVTGAISGIVVVDADSPEAIVWCDANLPPTPMQSKTAKGKHYLYGHPGIAIPNGVKLKGMALDVRGDGGQIVAPGSIHPSGVTYEEIGDWSSIENLPVFDPAWVAPDKPTKSKNVSDKQAKPKAKKNHKETNVIEYLKNVEPSVEGNGGDVQAFKVAAYVIETFNLTIDQVLILMLEHWNERCSPPWDSSDLRNKIDNAFKYSKSQKEAKGLNFLLDSKGAIKSSPGNLAKIFRYHPKWGDKLSLNTMNLEVNYEHQPISEYLIDEIQEWLENTYGVSFPKREDVLAKLIAQASKNSYHPVQTYLKELPEWDGVERFHKVASEILNAEEHPLNESYLRCLFVGLVSRAMEPGIKMDTVFVLVGDQGVGKSTFFKILGGDFYSDSFIDPGTKDSYLQLASAWLYELPEVDWVFSRKATEVVKGFLSSSHDNFRPPYARKTIKHPRSSVFTGTTNRIDFLTDPTGHRRFHVIRVGSFIDLKKLKEWMEQLWAEAYFLYKNNTQHWLTKEEELVQEERASEFESIDPWEESLRRIEKEMETGVSNRNKKSLSIVEILKQIGVEEGNATRRESVRLGALLRKMGWNQIKRGKVSEKAWVPRFQTIS